MEFYRLLDLLELNLSGEELSRNMTWNWVFVQELNGCIGIGVWMEWFHSGISIPKPWLIPGYRYFELLCAVDMEAYTYITYCYCASQHKKSERTTVQGW